MYNPFKSYSRGIDSLKINYFVSFLFFLQISAGAQTSISIPPKFSLNGNIIGLPHGKLYLEYFDFDNKKVRDSSIINAGRFSFEGNVIEPTLAALFYGRKSDLSPNYVELYIEPRVMGISLQFNKFKFAKVNGSETHLELEKLNIIKSSTSLKIDSIYNLVVRNRDLLSKLKDTVKINKISKVQDGLLEKLSELNAQKTMLELAFIKEHPSSFMSPELLFYRQGNIPLDSAMELYSSFSDAVKESREGKSVFKEISKRKNSSVGSTAPEFVIKDIDNRLITLSSFKNQSYVLLDFWASWCEPCRANLPHLKKVFEKYSEKGLKILTISRDFVMEDWQKAVSAENISAWINCSIFEDYKPDKNGELHLNAIEDNYFIPAIPLTILIDKNGVIVGNWLGKTEENNEQLETILETLMPTK